MKTDVTHQQDTILQQSLLPRFGSGFLEDHARLIINDPQIALVELVANCWDAGADRVEITWPDPPPDSFEITDNGTGMTYEEFTKRWPELNYNRIEAQGEDVIFPQNNQKSRRKVFGRNGKGRHSMFCFASEYFVETWQNGIANKFSIKRTSGTTMVPFTITHIGEFPKEGHGTKISTELVRNHLRLAIVHDLIGSKFVADPSFKIYLNGKPVELTNIEHLSDTREISIPNLGIVIVRSFDSQKVGKTSKQHGVAWWVNKRLVGEPSWKDFFDDDTYLDARTSEAKRYTFVVEADILVDDVQADWSDFKDTEKFRTVRSKVKEHVRQRLRELMQDVHKSHKRAVIEENRNGLENLPIGSRYHIGQFVNRIQDRLPTIEQRVLSATVGVLSNLEKSRYSYNLMEQLAMLQPDDLDALSEILNSWSLQEARIVLNELEKRLKLIQSLEDLVESPSSDELHDIQPLFERGLWIFGPEYESISFTSNRTLLTVVGNFFQDKLIKPLLNPRKRPDFVVLPDSTVGIYATDAYDDRSEVSGISKVLIVELKRGGFEITRKEKQQAQDYASELRKSGKVQKTTEIVGFVLGTTIAEEATELVKEGNTTIYARTYSTVLRQAHARTFKLLEKIKKAKDELSDPEIEQVLGMPKQVEMFSDKLLPTTEQTSASGLFDKVEG